MADEYCAIINEDCCPDANAHESMSYSHNYEECSLVLQDLPEEVLEQILAFLSPYKDMEAAKIVSKQWLRLIQSLVSHNRRHFYHNLSNCDVSWTEVVRDIHKKAERTHYSHITERFSHSAAYLNGSMYVFGGCTSTNTTFNDLWIFDLNNRQWVRPVAMGSYPSPKACATMVEYNGNLVLFGGWSHPIPYPLHQSAHYFSELHIYSPVTNRWSHILSLGAEPEALGGHSASVAGHLMIVFGGSPRPGQGTNNLWVFNFLKGSWKLQPVSRNAKPEPRYGQFQTTLDDKHVLMMGGCVGPNRPYNDLWMLTISEDDLWQWSKITMEMQELAAPQTWCHAACKVQHRIIVVSKTSKPRKSKNIKPRIHALIPPEKISSSTSSFVLQASSESLQSPSEKNSSESDDSGNQESQGAKSNLLALQQKLHRECANLSDPDDHHHNPQRINKRIDESEPESQILRLQNRYSQGADQGAHSSGSCPTSSTSARGLGRNAMPSIRPNAMNNRQKQLEALQRQEELMRAKSRALAAARQQSASISSNQEEVIPEFIETKNRMDVHVLDISRVATENMAEWKPLSELQASNAPTETICCSLVEGRGELIMFGGVVREATSPVTVNTAINKLFILQS